MKVYAKTFDSEEQGAVVSARTSRSPNTFDVIHEEVKAKGHETFLKQNVIGYGHDSVAEVAQCPLVCIEDVSDLAANVVALADPQLVVQMTSTRYQDMAQRACRDIRGDVSEHGVTMKGRYSRAMTTIEALLEKIDHPKKRTLQCDIARAHLPAGISTQFGIRGNARVMRDAVAFMLGHPIHEVQLVGAGVQAAIKEHIEVLFDRHVTPAPAPLSLMADYDMSGVPAPGVASFGDSLDSSKKLIEELTAWRESGWRRRARLAAVPHGPWWHGNISADYGAYRDLRRNRTIAQEDVLPTERHLPQDPLWAFRDLYPDLCKQVEDAGVMKFEYAGSNEDDPYVAPMGALMDWDAGGHALNWAYLMRLRSWAHAKEPKAGCHPAYAIPTRHLMKEVVEKLPRVADAMGLVHCDAALCGVEFVDRIPS